MSTTPTTTTAAGGGTLLTCSLSGKTLTPNDNPVITPSGHICTKRLLLTKLTENGGQDPFDNNRTLNEDDLVDVKIGDTILPPRAPSSTSLPSLLTLIQVEYDATLLELFDTRKALEETRRELSQALYQNDAAVRVIARLAMERDSAREEVRKMSVEVGGVEGRKRRRVEEEEGGAAAPGEKGGKAMDVDQPAKPAVVEPDITATNVTPAAPTGPSDKIPSEALDAMISIWKTLSKTRRKRPTPPNLASPTDLSTYVEVDKKSLHKSSSKPGVLTLAKAEGSSDIIVSAGNDRQLVVFNKTEGKIVSTVNGLGDGKVACMDIFESKVIVVGCDDGSVKVYTSSSSENGEYTSKGSSVMIDKEHKSPIVGVSIQPTGTYLLVTTQSGKIAFCDISSAGLEEIKIMALFHEKKKKDDDKDGEKMEYTCSALHPDGLILAVGTSLGKVQIWDLKTQTLAGTLEGHTDPITCISFSNNGYHIAHSSSSHVIVSDLRKLKNIATLQSTITKSSSDDGDEKDEKEHSIGTIRTVSFDESGKYLAYGGDNGGRVTVVKEWGVTTTFGGGTVKSEEGGNGKAGGGSGVTDLVWGCDAKWIATCSSNERQIRFWSMKEEEMEEVKKKEEVKKEKE